MLQGFWRGHDPGAWASNAAVFITLADRILKLGEPLFAYDVVDEGIKHFPVRSIGLLVLKLQLTPECLLFGERIF